MEDMIGALLTVLYVAVLLISRTRSSVLAAVAFTATLLYGYTVAYQVHTTAVVHTIYSLVYIITIFFMFKDPAVNYNTCLAMLASALVNTVMILAVAMFYLFHFNWELIGSCYVYMISAINLYIIFTIYRRAKDGQGNNTFSKFVLTTIFSLSNLPLHQKENKRGKIIC
jgi:hypothetical protein